MKPSTHRPQHNQHWRPAIIQVKDTSRIPLWWTPDPEHSPMLRMLRDGEKVQFVAEVKFEHWVIIKIEHQVGWVDLRLAHPIEILEPEPAPPEKVVPQSEIDTMTRRPRKLDNALLERDETEPSRPDFIDHLEMPSENLNTINNAETESVYVADDVQETPDKPATRFDRNDVHRLINHFKGITKMFRDVFQSKEKD